MEQPAMKLARFLVGCTVEGGGVYLKQMIPVDHEVCRVCLGGGRDLSTDEICRCCEGGGTIAPTPEDGQ